MRNVKFSRNSKWFFLLLGAGVALSIQAFAKPAQVVITRHGEKPEDKTNYELNQQGCARAYSLPNFFLKDEAVQAYGNPVAIFAMKPDRDDGSIRPIQTISPTADLLGLTINDRYTRLEFAAIVQEIMTGPAYTDKTVLISWEHKAIPDLAQAFGVVLDDGTQKWPGKVFDEAWVINFSKKSADLTIIPERVLSTDNPKGGNHWTKGPTSDEPAELSDTLSQECENNDGLNVLVKKWVSPQL